MAKRTPRQQPEEERLAFRNPIKAAGYSQVWHVMLVDPLLSKGAILTHQILLSFAGENETCWPGVERLAWMQRISERAVVRYLAELVEAGYISRQRRFGTSALTLIEDIEQSPRHQELARLFIERKREKLPTPPDEPPPDEHEQHDEQDKIGVIEQTFEHAKFGVSNTPNLSCSTRQIWRVKNTQQEEDTEKKTQQSGCAAGAGPSEAEQPPSDGGEEELFGAAPEPVKHSPQEIRAGIAAALESNARRSSPAAQAWAKAAGDDSRLALALVDFCELFERTPPNTVSMKKTWVHGMRECAEEVGYDQLRPLMAELQRRMAAGLDGYTFTIADPHSITKSLMRLRDECAAPQRLGNPIPSDATARDLASLRGSIFDTTISPAEREARRASFREAYAAHRAKRSEQKDGTHG